MRIIFYFFFKKCKLGPSYAMNSFLPLKPKQTQQKKKNPDTFVHRCVRRKGGNPIQLADGVLPCWTSACSRWPVRHHILRHDIDCIRAVPTNHSVFATLVWVDHCHIIQGKAIYWRSYCIRVRARHTRVSSGIINVRIKTCQCANIHQCVISQPC